MKTRVFISHPYSDNPELRKEQVDIICKQLVEEESIIPLSPLHLFSFFDNDGNVRGDILEVCLDLIKMSDRAYFYVYEDDFYSQFSKHTGQNKEFNYACHVLRDHTGVIGLPKQVELRNPPEECLKLS